MQLTEALYVTTSSVLVISGLLMVGMAVRAYAETNNRSMVHLSLGFTFVVAAAVSTAVSVALNSYEAVSLLTVNSGLSAAGFLFVVYSLLSYQD